MKLTRKELKCAKGRYTLAGIKDAVVVFDNQSNVVVKELTKNRVLRLIKELGSIPANATIFYFSETNFNRLIELYKDGEIVDKDCGDTLIFTLPQK